MFFFAGEFGKVHKAHLVNKERQTGRPETAWKSRAVAVKHLKGTYNMYK